ncbi:hypothetical protein KZZ52_39990 [Dactylosporangium sp. AC04546]|nr:hypothetical protein [Dactylosporangium sp. AC04546]WVK80131.1 hypothetical protein KZZ52_39990 [Dactylosporangium sp. AC04546]
MSTPDRAGHALRTFNDERAMVEHTAGQRVTVLTGYDQTDL